MADEDIIRVLRVLEYVGPRAAVEAQIERSLHGTKTYPWVNSNVTIRAATLGTFPEILDMADFAATVEGKNAKPR